MNKLIRIQAVCLITVGLMYASVAEAQVAPAVQWGEMDLQTSLSNCLGRAKKAYFDAGVQKTQIAGWLVDGEKGSANVLVSCTPLASSTSHLVVVTTSSDSKAAELLRNDIRARIASMREFD